MESAATCASLASFLDRVAPIMESELVHNAQSRAFDEHSVVWEEERDTMNKLFSLRQVLCAQRLIHALTILVFSLTKRAIRITLLQYALTFHGTVMVRFFLFFLHLSVCSFSM